MPVFNYYGLVIMIFLMIPNIVVSLVHKEVFENFFDCKPLEIAEQIGRYGSFILMVINIPYTYGGWVFDKGELIYVIINGNLILAYELIWIIMRNNNNMTRAVLLSVIPSFIFIFSGVMLLNIPLTLFSILFAASHITISVKNAKYATLR